MGISLQYLRFTLFTGLNEFLNANCTTWLAVSSTLSSFPCVWENFWEGKNEISALPSISRKCHTFDKAQ